MRDQPGGPLDPAGFRAAMQGKRLFSSLVIEGVPVRVYSAPWMQEERQAGVVQVPRELTEVAELRSSQWELLLAWTPLGLGLAALAGWLLTGSALRPVAEVTRAAAQIGEQDLSRRLPVHGKDEMAALAETFNGMIARLETSFKSREEAYRALQEAFERQKQFTADASHELRTPLTRVKIATSLALMDDSSEKDTRRSLETIDAAADEMDRLIRGLLTLARMDARTLRTHLEETDVTLLAKEIAGSMQRKTPVAVSGPEALRENVDPGLLGRLITNLIENAIRHTPDDKSIVVRITEQQETWSLEVIDEGEGIPSEHLPRVTERFYRVDSARNREDGGMGLGLAICLGITEAHHGSLHIESKLGQGTTVTAKFPKQPAQI